MTDDVLAVWMDGFSRPAGYLSRADDGATAFAHNDEHLASATGAPLSLSMPLQAGRFDDVRTRAFFANLLREDASSPLIEQLEAATRTLRSLGLKSFDDLLGRETERLVDLLSAAVDVRERDAFRDRAGGWGVGS